MCFCDRIPTIANRTEILVLQHRRERFHAFNTARIVRKALTNSTLIVDRNRALAERLNVYPMKNRVGILYPGPGGCLLTEVPVEQRPEQLIVIDGTWHHAKTMLRDIPRLNDLPRYQIQPTEPGRYRIRREPNDTALSTLEATVAALRALEPDTPGLDELLVAFETMVQSQLDHPEVQTNWRRNAKRNQNTMAIPRAILGDAKCDEGGNGASGGASGGNGVVRSGVSGVVVVYGESQPGQLGCKRSPRRKDHRQPIFWVARRLDTGESFRVAIESPVDLSDDFLSHIRLPRQAWRKAQSVDAFVRQWDDFIHPSDAIVAHHAGTLRMLRNVGGAVPNPIILKSIKLNPPNELDPSNQSTTLDSFLKSMQVRIATPVHPSRADQRLENAIALTRYLQQLARSIVRPLNR